MTQPAFLVFDIETVVDGRLVQRVRYPDEPGLSPEEAVTRYQAEQEARHGSSFIPASFHVPVVIAIAETGGDHELRRLHSLDRPRFRSHVLVRDFWEHWRAAGHPTLVTFNGTGFDLPVLEMQAFRLGLPLADWLGRRGGRKGPRGRLPHLDLADALAGPRRRHVAGGLDLLAKLLGTPGKMGVSGTDVQRLWRKGRTEAIDDYCACDVLDTYFVLLRWLVLTGEITPERETRLREGAVELIREESRSHSGLAEYLERLKLQPITGGDSLGEL